MSVQSVFFSLEKKNCFSRCPCVDQRDPFEASVGRSTFARLPWCMMDYPNTRNIYQRTLLTISAIPLELAHRRLKEITFIGQRLCWRGTQAQTCSFTWHFKSHRGNATLLRKNESLHLYRLLYRTTIPFHLLTPGKSPLN